MLESFYSDLLGSGITLSILAVVFWISKNFVLKYITNSVNHEFSKRIEIFKSELQEKQQEQQHFHELLIRTISQENKELLSRKITAADHLWKSLLSMKKFSVAVQFLATLNFEEIKKQARDFRIQKFLNSFPQCSFTELLEEMKNTQGSPAELSRPWISLKAWSLYLAYNMIIYYAITQFESAKFGGELDKLYDENKLVEIIQNALPDITITRINPSLLSETLNLIELSLLIELKSLVEQKEDNTAIERAKRIFTIYTEVKSNIKLKDIK